MNDTTPPTPEEHIAAYQAMIESLEAVSMSDNDDPDELIAVLLEIYGDMDAVEQALNHFVDILREALVHLDELF